MSDRCETCRFVHQTSTHGTPFVGQCHRYPHSEGNHPKVYWSDWCGEHQPREPKQWEREP